MWNSHYAKNKQAAKKNKKKQPFSPKLHRVKADLKLSGRLEPTALMAGRLVLSEMSDSGLFLFCQKPVMVGESMSVTLEHPRRFFVKGRVISCQEILPPSKIISAEQFAYRLEIEFIMESEEEREAIRAFRGELAAAGLTQAIHKQAA